MKKVTDKQVLDAVERHGQNVDDIAKELNLAKSNTFYRLRTLKSKGRLNQDGEIVSQDTFTTSAINRDDKKADKIQAVVKGKLDIPSMMIKKNPLYKRRQGIDDVVENLLKHDEIVCLIGEAGSGKTTLPEQLSSTLDVPFLRVSCTDNLVLTDLLGTREIVDGTTFYRTGCLTEIVQIPSVVLIDEFSLLPSGRSGFLHEFCDRRRLLIKDGNGGQVINFHKDCRVLLATNPNTSKYSGTNRINSALADRLAPIYVPMFKPEDVSELFDTGDVDTTKDLMQFYVEVNDTIKQSNMRITFSLRGVQRISKGLRRGDTIQNALNYGLLNHALLTATEKEKDSLLQIARVTFGANNFVN